MNHENLAALLRCPECGCEMRYRPKVYSYCCEGRVLHTYRVRDQIADMVHGQPEGRLKAVNRAFERVAGRFYEKYATGATPFARFLDWALWGTTKYTPLLFELLESVASDCEPGYFLDIPVGTGVFTAGEYSLQPNLEFIAADYSRKMLKAAQDKIQAEDFGSVMLVRTDVARLPFADGAFTGILTMNGFGAFPEPGRALDELVRVLAPNGKLAGSMYIYGERLMSDVLAGHLGVWLGYFSTPIFTEAEFLGALQIRGVNNIVTRKMNSILFFSGRKCEPAPEEREWHNTENAKVGSDTLKS